MSAEKELLELRSFWASITIPIVISSGLGCVIRTQTPLQWDFSWIGTNLFLDIFKVPLGILALIFPSVALVASNHRSRQSARLISLQNSQNIFVNHYTHMDKFEEHCRELETFKKSFLSAHNPRIFHSVIYPRSKDGDYSLNSEFLSKFGKKNGELMFRAVDIRNRFTEGKITRDQARTMVSEFIIEALKLVLFVDGQFRIPLDNIRMFSDLMEVVVSLSELVQAFTEFDGSSQYRFEVGYLRYFGSAALGICEYTDIALKSYKDRFDIKAPGAAELYHLFGTSKEEGPDVGQDGGVHN
ncbi:MAG: hypothetical protein HY035_03625 [Nitrospirae bacterium]|nr:hypothetical protein [Nitrospirota bacterium]